MYIFKEIKSLLLRISFFEEFHVRTNTHLNHTDARTLLIVLIRTCLWCRTDGDLWNGSISTLLIEAEKFFTVQASRLLLEAGCKCLNCLIIKLFDLLISFFLRNFKSSQLKHSKR